MAYCIVSVAMKYAMDAGLTRRSSVDTGKEKARTRRAFLCAL